MASHSLRLPLFLTRLSIFYFMGVWALDRIIAPDHAVAVANKFYKIGPLNIAALPQPVLGAILLVIYTAETSMSNYSVIKNDRNDILRIEEGAFFCMHQLVTILSANDLKMRNVLCYK